MSESLFQTLLDLYDDEEQKQLLNRYYESLVLIVTDALRELDNPTCIRQKEIVCLLRNIGFPANASALSVLWKYALNPLLPGQQEAYQTLTQIHPWQTLSVLLHTPALAPLVDIKKDRLIRLLSQAHMYLVNLNPEMEEQLVQEIIEHAEEWFDVTLCIFRLAPARWGTVVARVLQTMNVSYQETAFPLILEQAADLTDIGNLIARDMLLSMGTRVIPYYIQTCLEGKRDEIWGDQVAAICRTLLKLQDRNSMEQCIPALLYVLSQEQFRAIVPVDEILEILDYVRGNALSFALPTLFHLLLNDKRPETRKYARHLIESVAREELQLYLPAYMKYQ